MRLQHPVLDGEVNILGGERLQKLFHLGAAFGESLFSFGKGVAVLFELFAVGFECEVFGRGCILLFELPESLVKESLAGKQADGFVVIFPGEGLQLVCADGMGAEYANLVVCYALKLDQLQQGIASAGHLADFGGVNLIGEKQAPRSIFEIVL